jgi:tetratricopeptide (TPR) repeat protein
MQEVLQRAGGSQETGEPDWNLLNADPRPCVSAGADQRPELSVISWGDWAMFAQRHLGHVLHQQHVFLQQSWGVPDLAAQFATQIEETFGQARIFPFVRFFTATDQATYEAAANACSSLVFKTPHLFGPGLWNRFYEPPYGVNPYTPPGLWEVWNWHKYNPPPFTAYLVQYRLNYSTFTEAPNARQIMEALHERAPYDIAATRALLHVRHGRYGAGAPAEALESAYGPVLDFAVSEMARVARFGSNTPAFYERYMARAATFRPVHFFDLGDYFAERNQEDKAVQFYEEGVAKCPDAVAVSNQSRWLVGYYFRNDRIAEADALANRVAEVYSSAGLKTKGDLLYWKKQYRESLDYYKRIEERYNRPDYVVNWWADYRGVNDDPQFDQEIEKRLAHLFPNGIEQVTTNSFRGRPQTGLHVGNDNDRVREIGMEKGDIIVALDGIRVHDLPQYVYVRSRLKTPELRLIWWTGQRYLEAVASPPAHRFGADFHTLTSDCEPKQHRE